MKQEQYLGLTSLVSIFFCWTFSVGENHQNSAHYVFKLYFNAVASRLLIFVPKMFLWWCFQLWVPNKMPSTLSKMNITLLNRIWSKLNFLLNDISCVFKRSATRTQRCTVSFHLNWNKLLTHQILWPWYPADCCKMSAQGLRDMTVI